MLRKTFLFLATLCASSAIAHHSIVSEYPANQGLQLLSGTVTKVRWHAPHVEIYIEAQGGIASGGEQWIVNSHAPGLLARTYGIVKDDIALGDSVAFVGWPSDFDVPRYHMRALSINGGPMRSTHRPSDRRALQEGTLGEIVPAPGLDVDETYGGNIGGSSPQATDQKDVVAQSKTGNITVGSNVMIWAAVIFGLLLVAFGLKRTVRS
jgi:hypothetical protein